MVVAPEGGPEEEVARDFLILDVLPPAHSPVKSVSVSTPVRGGDVPVVAGATPVVGSDEVLTSANTAMGLDGGAVGEVNGATYVSSFTFSFLFSGRSLLLPMCFRAVCVYVPCCRALRKGADGFSLEFNWGVVFWGQRTRGLCRREGSRGGPCR